MSDLETMLRELAEDVDEENFDFLNVTYDADYDFYIAERSVGKTYNMEIGSTKEEAVQNLITKIKEQG